MMLQARAYARANGVPYEKQEMDRSIVSDADSYDDEDHCYGSTLNKFILINPEYTWILILCIFLSSNLLVLTTVLLNFRKIYLRISGQGKLTTKILYKASAIVLTCVNIIAFIIDIVFTAIENNSIMTLY